MRFWVVTHNTMGGEYRLLSQHPTRWGAQRRAQVFRDVLADIFADTPLDTRYMGAVRVMSYRDFLEVPQR